MQYKSKIRLSSPLTHSDWSIHEDGPEWGEAGIRSMLEHCRAFGLDQIYWRVFDCGRSTYASRLMEPFKWDEHEPTYQFSAGYIEPPPGSVMDRIEKINYYGFDTLEAAVRIGHELGLSVHAWMTINEDDHALGWPSRFVRRHPEYRWIRRNGQPYHSQLSFAFREVREYKLALIREMLAYDVDGIFLDWMRTGDIRDNPQNDDNGAADYGYEQPNIDAFTAQYGIDPHDVDNGDERWVACRARPLTEFMREARKMISGHEKPITLSAMVQHPWAYRGILSDMVTKETPDWVINIGGHRIDGALRGLLCDVGAWAREGLVDELIASGYYTGGGDSEKAYRYLQAETNGKIPIKLYCWVPRKADAFEYDRLLAEKLGAHEMLFWEADYIDTIPEPDRKMVTEAIEKYKNK